MSLPRICAAIDGTGSSEWRPINRNYSHVKSFFLDYKTPWEFKRYWDGPNDEVAGSDCEIIRGDVFKWIVKLANQYGSRNKRAAVYIDIVGHSRGGAIAIDLASMLEEENLHVNFLGLYDAVDRSVVTGEVFGAMTEALIGVPTINNVFSTHHAMRDPRLGSRSSFSNTGLKSSNSIKKKYFFTSHGGVGGALTLDAKSLGFWDAVTSDLTTAPSDTTRGIYSSLGGKSKDPRDYYIEQSIEADNWIRRAAVNRGIGLETSHRNTVLRKILDGIKKNEMRRNSGQKKRGALGL